MSGLLQLYQDGIYTRSETCLRALMTLGTIPVAEHLPSLPKDWQQFITCPRSVIGTFPTQCSIVFDSDSTIDDDLTRYVLDYYQHLCTETEQLALRVLNLRLKAENSENPLIQRRLAELQRFAHDDGGQQTIACGRIPVRRPICQRLLRDHEDETFLNYCLQCEALCRTPKAQMCVKCGYSWHTKADG